MSEVITSGKVIQKPDLVIEVDDFLPPGLIGVRTRKRDEAGSFDSSSPDSSFTLVEEDLPGSDSPGEPQDWLYDTLPVPNDMVIISQTSRVGPDGKMVVDVVIETPDFPGIVEFESRLIRDSSA